MGKMVKEVNSGVLICVGKEVVWEQRRKKKGESAEKIDSNCHRVDRRSNSTIPFSVSLATHFILFNLGYCHVLILLASMSQMIDDQDLGFFANFLGVFIFVLVIAYHFVMADPKFEGN
ncbi:hypothetical protein VNO80_26193 [Phaseolus coccineus]|uniref:Dolichyl-diphosphooligosaccharide--protein glycosyltransferase subunit 4 n=1 Tax=Phaseolus coccineus TaxID=3886 RepID=A0AAN9LF56_PHACN